MNQTHPNALLRRARLSSKAIFAASLLTIAAAASLFLAMGEQRDFAGSPGEGKIETQSHGEMANENIQPASLVSTQ